MTLCTNCQNGGSGMYIQPPHPFLYCVVDDHCVPQVLDLKATAKMLMDKCPLGYEVDDDEFEEAE